MTSEDTNQVTQAGEQKEQLSTEQAAAREGEVAGAEEKPVDIETLQQEIEKQRELAKYHLDQWKRTAADLENYRKRVDKERADWLKFGQAALFTQLLPVLDDFDRAFQTVPKVLTNFTWIEGMALIERKLRLVLEQRGLKEIETDGKPFDPSVHQAILQEENDSYPDGQVIATVQKGYMLHDRVLRPAMVVVARNTQNSKSATMETNQATANELLSSKEGSSENK